MPVSVACLPVAHVGLNRKELLAGCLLSLSQNHPPGRQTPADAGSWTHAPIICMASPCRTAAWNWTMKTGIAVTL